MSRTSFLSTKRGTMPKPSRTSAHQMWIGKSLRRISSPEISWSKLSVGSIISLSDATTPKSFTILITIKIAFRTMPTRSLRRRVRQWGLSRSTKIKSCFLSDRERATSQRKIKITLRNVHKIQEKTLETLRKTF